ncbi:MAG: DUF488 family protein [Opitutaceae bacterium]|nr:DUF488 family protein [Opitutaceae bacterium]
MKKAPIANLSIKRVYEKPSADDGCRLLAERLWPRGLRKESARLDGWMREAAPSTPLRQWFSHQIPRWEEFQRRYRLELEARREAWQPILDAASKGRVTLLFSSRDTEHNNVVALRTFLLERLAESGTPRGKPSGSPTTGPSRKPRPRTSQAS